MYVVKNHRKIINSTFKLEVREVLGGVQAILLLCYKLTFNQETMEVSFWSLQWCVDRPVITHGWAFWVMKLC